MDEPYFAEVRDNSDLFEFGGGAPSPFPSIFFSTFSNLYMRIRLFDGFFDGEDAISSETLPRRLTWRTGKPNGLSRSGCRSTISFPVPTYSTLLAGPLNLSPWRRTARRRHHERPRRWQHSAAAGLGLREFVSSMVPPPLAIACYLLGTSCIGGRTIVADLCLVIRSAKSLNAV